MKISKIRAKRAVAFAAIATALLLSIFTDPVPAAQADQISGVPESDALAFTVLRDGSPIGTHDIVFSENGQKLTVDITTDIKVKLPLIGIVVYRFAHQGHETWVNGALTELSSVTNDDGTDHQVKAVSDGSHLAVESDVTSHDSQPGIIPGSLWNPAVRDQSILLNTLDGTEMKVTIDALDMEEISTSSGSIKARHVRIRGDLQRDLWYAEDGRLVRMVFAAKDDSQIEYRLK